MTAPAHSRIPDPASRFGFTPGSDRKLIRWSEMVLYFQDVARESDRVAFEILGTVSGNHPLIMLTISSPENLANRETLKTVQKQLADPRSLSEAETANLTEQGRTIVLLTCSIHATEVGSAQMTPELVYELATSDDPETRRILENVVLLLVPSLNPWGMELVHDWYEITLNTHAEGTSPPELYHPYSGHDNNRDWFMLTQVENQLLVDKVHNVWHPHIIFDQHQMMSDGPRYVLPPFIDPYDPNIDPILQAEIAQLGTAMASELTSAGKAGVATEIIFDAWSPSRAYQHYHGGVRILSEAASCRIATPITLNASQLQESRGFDPSQRRANHPLPWRGGTWRLRDILDYNKLAAWACLRNAASYRRQWISNFARVQRNSMEINSPYAWIIPEDQDDPGAMRDLLNVMSRGLVEIEQATESFRAGGVEYPAGTMVIRVGQPFGRFARTLLEIQHYPDLRDNPDSPPKPPYDITAHTLPLYLSVEAVLAEEPFNASLEPLHKDFLIQPAGTVTGHGEHGWAINPGHNQSVLAINRFLSAGASVFRTVSEFTDGATEWPAGTFLVETDDHQLLKTIAEDTGVDICGLHWPTNMQSRRLREPRIGLYRSWHSNAMDEGWTRFILEQYEFSFATLRDQEIRQGNLFRNFDVILLTHQPAEDIIYGNSALEYPGEYSGGIGDRGAANLRRFAESGGTLITIDGACEVALRHLYLPVINPLETLSDKEFYAPGAMLQMLVDPRHPVGYGFDREVAGLMTGRHTFSPISEDEVNQVARFPANNQLLSGWILGTEHIRGTASLIDIPVEDGRAILFGFRPQFRAQTRGTYRLLFNALYYAGLESTPQSPGAPNQ